MPEMRPFLRRLIPDPERAAALLGHIVGSVIGCLALWYGIAMLGKNYFGMDLQGAREWTMFMLGFLVATLAAGPRK